MESLLLQVKVFGIKLMNAPDFWELLVRYSFNFLIAFILIRLLYYPIHKRKDYLFTYFMFNTLIFFLCLLLNSVKLSMGFAFGLFAIFGILRYRTEQLPIKEMTYLFIVIAIAVINSVSNKKISIAELVLTNAMIVFITYVLEKLWLLRHESQKSILYEKIELIKPERRAELIEDLEARTGLDIKRIHIGKIDFLRDVARIQVFYYEDENVPTIKEDYQQRDQDDL